MPHPALHFGVVRMFAVVQQLDLESPPCPFSRQTATSIESAGAGHQAHDERAGLRLRSRRSENGWPSQAYPEPNGKQTYCRLTW